MAVNLKLKPNSTISLLKIEIWGKDLNMIFMKTNFICTHKQRNIFCSKVQVS